MSSNQLTGKAGVYYCCYKLSVLGWNVTLTVRSAQGVDINARRGSDTGPVGVQVRTLSKRAPVPLGPTLDSIMGDYWIIISDAITESPKAFVLLPSEVRNGAHRSGQDGNVSYWLEPKDYELDAYREAWGRLGQLIEP